MTIRYLVVHEDKSGDLDVAEVTAETSAHALEQVDEYADTREVFIAIEFDGEPPKVFDAYGDRIGATEGNALEDAAKA